MERIEVIIKQGRDGKSYKLGCICLVCEADRRQELSGTECHRKSHELLKAIVDCYGLGQSPERFCQQAHDFIMEAYKLIYGDRG